MQYSRAHLNHFGYHNQVVHTQQIFSNVKAINRYIFGHVVHIELKHSQVYTVGMLNFNRYALNADRIVISKSQ